MSNRTSQLSVRLTPEMMLAFQQACADTGIDYSVMARLLVDHSLRYVQAHGIGYFEFLRRLGAQEIDTQASQPTKRGEVPPDVAPSEEQLQMQADSERRQRTYGPGA